MRILVEQLNGETIDLEVTAEITIREVKEQLKRMHTWEDEPSRSTTLVELLIGDKRLTNEETVEELGLREDSKLTAVFKKNVIQCCNKSGVGPDLDPEALVIVEVPDSETAIEAQAFRGCSRLAKVIIPSSVAGIGSCAFYGCSSLVSFNIPESVALIPDFAFYLCCALTEVTIPDSITQVGACAFALCKALQSVSIPNSVTRIQGGCFADCSCLVSVNIPESVRWIGDRAFADCTSLTSVEIPDTVITIGNSAFFNCTHLTLTAPARLLETQANNNVYKLVAKECACGRCNWRLFLKGCVCPVHHALEDEDLRSYGASPMSATG